MDLCLLFFKSVKGDRRMKKIKRIISLGLAVLMSCALIPTSLLFAQPTNNDALTDKTENYTINTYHFYDFLSNGQDEYFNNGPYATSPYTPLWRYSEEYSEEQGWAEGQTLEPYVFRTSTNEVTYCLELGKASPENTDMSYHEQNLIDYNKGILKVIQMGYPNKSGADYGTTDAELEWATAVALKIVQGKLYTISGNEIDSPLTLDAFEEGGIIDKTFSRKYYTESQLSDAQIAAFDAKADKVLNIIRQLVAYSNDDSIIIDNLTMTANNEFVIPAGQTQYLAGPFNVSLSSPNADQASLVVDVKGATNYTFADAQGNEISEENLSFGKDFYIKGSTSTDITLKVTAYASGLDVPIQYYYGTDETHNVVVNGQIYSQPYQRMYVYQTVTLQDEVTVDIKTTPATSLTIEKTWVDLYNKYSVRPDSIDVEILQNGKLYRTITLDKSDGISSISDRWRVTLTDLPKYDANGALFDYTAREDTSNINIKNFYLEPTYQVESWKTPKEISITNRAIYLPQKYTISFSKDIVNDNNQAATDFDFAKINLNPDDTYSFPIVLKELRKTVSVQNDQLVETYSGYTGKQYNGILTNKNTLVFHNISAGKYEISELATQYFDFVDFEKLSGTSGTSFSYENGKYYITISGITSKDENISVRVTNKIDSTRPYDEDDSITNLFKIEFERPEQTIT